MDKVNEKTSDKDTESIETKEVPYISPKAKGRDGPKIVLDTGVERVRFRQRWWQIW